jgi:predicted nuclease of predicted toxin-antitoxin system
MLKSRDPAAALTIRYCPIFMPMGVMRRRHCRAGPTLERSRHKTGMEARVTHEVKHAERDHRLLLTEDNDFGDLVFRQARPVPDIVLIRIVAMQRQRKAKQLTVAIERFGETLFGRYTVIEEARFRMRPLRLV